MEVDNPQRIRVLSGGREGSTFLHLSLPELTPGERHRATVEFIEPQHYTSAEAWKTAYGYAEDFVVYRLFIGPEQRTPTPKKTAAYFEMDRFEVYDQNMVIEVGKKLAFKLTFVNHGPLDINEFAIVNATTVHLGAPNLQLLNQVMDHLRTAVTKAPKVPMDIGNELSTEATTQELDQAHVSALLGGTGHVYFLILVDWVGSDNLPGHMEKCFFINKTPQSNRITASDMKDPQVVLLTKGH